MSTLSVLITYHNEKDLLKECLQSLVSQDQGPDEVLIYDDASKYPATDYLISDSRIRVIRGEKNEGPSFGRNVLLAEAKGDYIHYHDSDDWFASDWAKQIRRAIGFRHADAIFTEVKSYKSGGEVHSEHVLGLQNVTDHHSLIKFCIRRFMLVPAGTYKLRFVRNHGGYRTELWQSEDYEFNVRMALNLEIFELIPEPLVAIRLREESRSRNKVETNTYALEAVTLLKSETPRTYWKDLSEKAATIGRELFALGEIGTARRAFKVAKTLGPPKFIDEGPFYRMIARSLGQEAAEKTGQIYRHYSPLNVRRWLR